MTDSRSSALRSAPSTRIIRSLVAGTILVAAPQSARAQVFAGMSLALPAGGFTGASIGWVATVGAGATPEPSAPCWRWLSHFGVRVEASYSQVFTYVYEDAPDLAVRRLAAGASVAFYPLRGALRPYALGGASFGRRLIGWRDGSWEPGYHVGVGLEFASRRLMPFAEARYLRADAPGFGAEETFVVGIGVRLR